jgi:hypothetical protein
MRTKKLNSARSYCAGATGCICAFILFACSPVCGQVAGHDLLSTPVKVELLDPAAFCQMADGVERPMPLDDGFGRRRDDGPQRVLWTTTTAPAWDGAFFGDSKTPGRRSMRIGFAVPITVGAVLVRAGGTLSVLRPEASYPGNMADDSQWLAGQRLVRGQPSDEEVASEDYSVWVFPPGTKTRALRFAHTAQPTDSKYCGWLGGAYILAERMANVAPAAAVHADANNEAIGKINDESNNGGWSGWDNDAGENAPIVSPRHPVHVVLAWPAPVHVAGLAALGGGFGDADVQIYRGPADRHPSEAAEGDWITVKHWQNVGDPYPLALGPGWLDLGKSYTTRGVRLRITSAGNEGHPHLQGKTHSGRRVWIRELMALAPLDDASLEAWSREQRATQTVPGPGSMLPAPTSLPHPPIPVRFRLDEPGYVTLVIEDQNGVRVRNLISAARLPAGPNVVWWDGTTDLGRDLDAAAHGVYRIPAELAAVGTYQVRGLVHAGIHLRYEFPVYNAGDPPWPTADHTGGWLANHSPPSSALFVPADKAPGGKALVYLGSYVSEGRDGLAWVDLDGHKRGGVTWVGGAWTGAPFLARDACEQAAADTYMYVGSAWEGELRLTAMNASGYKPVVKYSLACGRETTSVALAGLAAHNGLLVCSLRGQNELLFIDAKAGKVLGKQSVDDPRGLAFDSHGLLVLSGRRLLRYSREQGNTQRVSEKEHAATPRSPLPAPRSQLPARFETLIADGLEDPQQIAVDAKGNYYISDRGKSHQVKVFDPLGKPLRAIGNAGPPRTGPYDPSHMNDPNGLTIDSLGRLWVAETNFQPKRVSVWTLDGRLLRAFYGPSEYGGGGTLDPVDKTRFYYHGMEFHLDWKTGTDRLARIFFRGPSNGLSESHGSGRGDVDEFDVPKGQFVNGLPETPLYVAGSLEQRGIQRVPGRKRSGPPSPPAPLPEGEGRFLPDSRQRYFTNCYTCNPTNGASIATLWIDRGDAAVPVAAIGRANDWDLLKEARFKARWPAGVEVEAGSTEHAATPRSLLSAPRFSAPLLFVWTDDNDDGRVQPSEVNFIRADVGGFTFMPDLSVAASWVQSTEQGARSREYAGSSLPAPRSMLYPVRGFTAGGAPRYDLAHGETLADGAQRPTSSGGDQALVERSASGSPGWTVLTVAPKPFAPQSVGGLFGGMSRWSYPDLWPGLHASHVSPPPEQPGELIGTTRLLGGFITPRRGDAGPLWAINANMGAVYLFTSDGLFVSEMFRDVRRGVSWAMPVAPRGMLLDNVSLHEENFWPSISQTADGQVYLVDGSRTSLVRVDGLDEIRRLPTTTINISKDDLASTHEYLIRNEARRQASQGRPTLHVALRETPPAGFSDPSRFKSGKPAVDGRLDDWQGADWVTIDRSGVAASFDADSKPYNIAASVAVAGDRLYAAFRTGDPNLLQNSGETPRAEFKTGGALDLMIGAGSREQGARSREQGARSREQGARSKEQGAGSHPEGTRRAVTGYALGGSDATPAVGDVRLLVTIVQGKTRAVLYSPRVEGSGIHPEGTRQGAIQRVPGMPLLAAPRSLLPASPVPFSSPSRTVTMDRVDDVSDHVQLVCGDGNFEFSVPLATLGLQARAGDVIRGDLGVLRGNGFQTLHRAYWSNKATAIVSDVPSEATLTPQLWGRWVFVPE